jgi:hypothetical protein
MGPLQSADRAFMRLGRVQALAAWRPGYRGVDPTFGARAAADSHIQWELLELEALLKDLLVRARWLAASEWLDPWPRGPAAVAGQLVGGGLAAARFGGTVAAAAWSLLLPLLLLLPRCLLPLLAAAASCSCRCRGRPAAPGCARP